MREYILNDIKFTPGPVVELMPEKKKDIPFNIGELRENSKKTWEKLEKYERDFKERQVMGSRS